MEEKVLSVDQMREVIDMDIDTSNASLYWAINKSNPRGRKQDLMKPFLTFYTINQVVGLESFEYIPTFTLQDILEMLPKRIQRNSKEYGWVLLNDSIAYWQNGSLCVQFDGKPLEAAFNILKWCKQNNEL